MLNTGKKTKKMKTLIVFLVINNVSLFLEFRSKEREENNVLLSA